MVVSFLIDKVLLYWKDLSKNYDGLLQVIKVAGEMVATDRMEDHMAVVTKAHTATMTTMLVVMMATTMEVVTTRATIQVHLMISKT